jgi:hypothetical protein
LQVYNGTAWTNLTGGTAAFAVPGAPTIGTATAGNAQASVPFTAPASDGGSTVVSYTATSSPEGITGTLTQAGSGTITVTGLTNGTAYTFTVTATNAIGTGAASTASNSVTHATVPGAPTIGTAVAGNGQALVPFTAPASDGGSTILSYTATSSPGGITGTLTQAGSGTITVTGLTNGTAYTFTVTATNAIGTGAPSAASNSVTPVGVVLAVGESYQGGKIAYILQSGDPGYDANVTHGIIAAPSDQSAGATWGCYGTTISGADGTALGTGNQNTLDIVAGCGEEGIAARLCHDLVLDGYSDWYLPSLGELNILYINRVVVGGFANAWYWSSSEQRSDAAWMQIFTNFLQTNGGKSTTFRVRAVRAF